MNSIEYNTSDDRFESEIDDLIEEIMRKTRNQQNLQFEIEKNQKKLDDIKANHQIENNSKKHHSVKHTQNKQAKYVDNLSPIVENDFEFIYDKFDEKINDNSTNSSFLDSTQNNVTLNDISKLIKTATDINNQNTNVDINFIKTFFQSEINNCIKNSDNDRELQGSLNKMLQDFLICLQSNLNEIKKNQTSQQKYQQKHDNRLTKINEEKYWTHQDLDPETQEKEVETVFKNIYRSHTLTHVFWDDQEEEEIDEDYEKHQKVKIYSTWSENLSNEKSLTQKKQIKCEFIPTIASTASKKLSKSTSQRVEEDKNAKKKLKTIQSSYEASKNQQQNIRNSTNYNSNRVNVPLQGGHNNKSANKFNRSLTTRTTDPYSNKQSYKNQTTYSTNRKQSASASVTNISEILNEIGKKNCSFDSNIQMKHSNYRNNNNNNVLKKFIHKIKTIV